MSRRVLLTTLAVGTTAALALGGGIAAWANWSTGSSETAVTAKVARIPTMVSPRVEMSGSTPKIVWEGVAVGGVPVDKYVVIRRDDDDRKAVCTVHSPVTACRDVSARSCSNVPSPAQSAGMETSAGPKGLGRSG